jgi:hypothetical protein
MAHSGKDPKDLPDPIVGQGHPMDPNRGQLLSEDDEKRIDEEGRPIADGLLWSEAASGAYVFVAVSSEPLTADRTLIGAHASASPATQGRHMTIGCAVGKPRFHQPFYGACLELPSDLGRDEIKRDYVAQWLANTAAEALVKSGVSLGGDPVIANRVAQWVAGAANTAINELGL